MSEVFYILFSELGSWSIFVIVGVVCFLAVVPLYLRRFQFLVPVAAGFSRLLRGFFLILWITVLSWVAFGSLTGDLANYVVSLSNEAQYLSISRLSVSKECENAQSLADYLRFRADPPPIGEILDQIIPGWEGVIMTAIKSKTRINSSK